MEVDHLSIAANALMDEAQTLIKTLKTSQGYEIQVKELLEIAASVTDAPAAVFTLLTKDKDSVESSFYFLGGDNTSQITLYRGSKSLENTFCLHTLIEEGVMIIEDAETDPRFALHPLVLAKALNFYVGIPIRVSGTIIATLAVCSKTTIEITTRQIIALETIAMMIGRRIEANASQDS